MCLGWARDRWSSFVHRVVSNVITEMGQDRQEKVNRYKIYHRTMEDYFADPDEYLSNGRPSHETSETCELDSGLRSRGPSTTRTMATIARGAPKGPRGIC